MVEGWERAIKAEGKAFKSRRVKWPNSNMETQSVEAMIWVILWRESREKGDGENRKRLERLLRA